MRNIILLIFINISLILASPVDGQVQVLEKQMSFPTYEMGFDEKHPQFKDYTFPGFDIFRGDRSVYPYTLLDEFSRTAINKHYKVLRLENEYLEADIIPGLRGRLQGAVDRRNGWDFIYYNHAIKPADIAVRLAWIAGGLEWNHPGGHGYSQFSAIPFKLKSYSDGSKSVIVSETEPVRQMKWETEVRMHPGKLYVETIGRLFSVAPYPVPFASSLNGAMHTSEKLEVIYPGGSYYTGHGKHSLHKWPYYGDKDMRMLENIRDVFSVFIEGEGLFQDYWGCYSHDEDIDAGTVIVADHRYAPGKKYFTWGSHEKALLWDEFLSDEDGGYIELQVQAFWDNLGYGYAWLDPLEVKEFSVYWYPIKNMGGFVKANKEICLNMTADAGNVALALQATGTYPDATVSVWYGNRTIYSETTDLMPAGPWKDTFRLETGTSYDELELRVQDENGRIMITYKTAPPDDRKPEMPVHHHDPGNMTIDQLYAKGKSFYQDPFGTEAERWYRVILDRDSLESRANRSLGLIFLHRNQADSARFYLEWSLFNDHLNEAYESYYYLGLAAMQEDDPEAAKRNFTVAGRRKPYKVLSDKFLAEIAYLEGDHKQALQYIEAAIASGATHPDVWCDKALFMRKQGRIAEAVEAQESAFDKDPLSFYALAEQWFLDGGPRNMKATKKLISLFDRGDATFIGSQIFLDVSRYYMRLAVWDDAYVILSNALSYYASEGITAYPLLHCYAAYLAARSGNEKMVMQHLSNLEADSSRYTFPYHHADFRVLKDCLERKPDNALIKQMLGNLYAYYRQDHRAIDLWEAALGIDQDNTTLLYSLAAANWKINQEVNQPVQYLERALTIDPEDTRIMLALDHLYQHAVMTRKRTLLFDEYDETVRMSDDLVLRKAIFSIQQKDYDTAIELMSTHAFFPREANHTKPVVITVYAEAFTGKGIHHLKNGKYEKALEMFEKADDYPPTLNDIAPEVPVHTRLIYYRGKALEGLGRKEDALMEWMKLKQEPHRFGYECDIDRARIMGALGKDAARDALLQSVVKFNQDRLPQLNDDRQRAVAHYVLSRAYREMRQQVKADRHYIRAVELDRDVFIHSKIEAAFVPLIKN